MQQSAPPPVKDPLKSPSAPKASPTTTMGQASFARLRLACAVATAVMTQLGPQDPLTQVYLHTAPQLLPPGWTIPGWSEGRARWLDTIRHCTTWSTPDQPAGAPQSVASTSTAPLQPVSLSSAPPPAPKLKNPPKAVHSATVFNNKRIALLVMFYNSSPCSAMLLPCLS